MAVRTTMDQAGRLVIPKQLRDQIGLTPGPVEVLVEGAGLRIEVSGAAELVTGDDGVLRLPAGGPEITADDIRELRLGDQR